MFRQPGALWRGLTCHCPSHYYLTIRHRLNNICVCHISDAFLLYYCQVHLSIYPLNVFAWSRTVVLYCEMIDCTNNCEKQSGAAVQPAICD